MVTETCRQTHRKIEMNTLFLSQYNIIHNASMNYTISAVLNKYFHKLYINGTNWEMCCTRVMYNNMYTSHRLYCHIMQQSCTTDSTNKLTSHMYTIHYDNLYIIHYVTSYMYMYTSDPPLHLHIAHIFFTAETKTES